MIWATVSFRVTPGKTAEAMAYLGRISKHINELGGSNYRLLTRLVGPAGHVILVSTFDSVATWDASRAKSAADPAAQKMIADAGTAGLFIPGSVEMALYNEA